MRKIALSSYNYSLMNVKHQDSVVSEQSVKEFETRVAYSSPKTEEVSLSTKNVILQVQGSGFVGDTEPED